MCTLAARCCLKLSGRNLQVVGHVWVYFHVSVPTTAFFSCIGSIAAHHKVLKLVSSQLFKAMTNCAFSLSKKQKKQMPPDADRWHAKSKASVDGSYSISVARMLKMKITFLSSDASYLLHLLLMEIHTHLLRQGSTGLPSEVRRIKWSNEITWCRLLITGNGRGVFIIKYSDGRNAKGGY